MGFTRTSDAALEECAREPIHLLGRIQACGFLLALDRARRVAAVSGNSGAWLGREPESLLGAPAESLLPVPSIEAAFAHARVAAATGHPQQLYHVGWPGRTEAVDVSVHRSHEWVVIEAEAAGTEPLAAVGAVERCTRALAELTDVEAVAQAAADAVAAITEHDRVMVYRFSADGSGTVIAERKARGQRPYLGLRYPASDIPPQARALYLRNPIRVIVDASDDGLPVHHRRVVPLDLSQATLRSVSPVHLQYLRNMGTAASMSISLIVDGRLWGLIACHHREPLRPTLACRQMAELLGRLVSLALSRAERRPLDREIRSLMFAPPGVDALADAAADREAACASVARLLGLSGVVLELGGESARWGQVPPEAQTQQILSTLVDTPRAAVTAVESLADLSPPLAAASPGVAGMLALRLPAPGRDCVLLLRDEVVRHVRWAGCPDKALQRGPDGRLSPRNSFAAWRAAVKGHCEPWTATEIELAEVMRTRLIEVLAARREQRVVESTRQAAQQQALLVRELNHRVRNMLGLIKGLVQQTARNARSVDDLTERLHDRVHALSRAYTQIEKSNWSPTPLASLLLEETGAFGEPGQVLAEGPPVLLEPQAYLAFAMVIHELATNARKYGALSVPQGRVHVTWQLSEGHALEIDWRERGGPPVARPERKGFGSRVIRQGLEHQLRGHATLDFEPAGLHARLWTPRGFVPMAAQPAPAPPAPEASSPVAAAQPPGAAANPVPAVALVVEDDLVIALLAETMLQHLGCGRVFTAGSADDALRLLRSQAVEVALIDVNLGDHSSERVALRLAELGVPTIVTTGYSETDSVPEPLRGLRRLNKPYTQAELATAVAGVVPA